MRDTSSNFVTEKNKSTNSPAHLFLIENYDGASNDLRYTDWPENIAYKSETWTAFPIKFNSLPENNQGQVDSVTLTLSNISLLIQSYLKLYDFGGLKVTIYTVFLSQLADSDANIKDVYYIDSYQANQKDVIFVLQSRFAVLNSIIPSREYTRNQCQWIFKSTECGYAGAETTCNRTLARCRVLGNSARIGLFASIPSRRIYVG